jgi:hypothetical protein
MWFVVTCNELSLTSVICKQPNLVVTIGDDVGTNRQGAKQLLLQERKNLLHHTSLALPLCHAYCARPLCSPHGTTSRCPREKSQGRLVCAICQIVV